MLLAVGARAAGIIQPSTIIVLGLPLQDCKANESQGLPPTS